jgi:hypothetical protein
MFAMYYEHDVRRSSLHASNEPQFSAAILSLVPTSTPDAQTLECVDVLDVLPTARVDFPSDTMGLSTHIYSVLLLETDKQGRSNDTVSRQR